MAWAALALGLLVLAKAVRDLAADARGEAEVSFGGAMLFGQQWLVGAVLVAFGGTRLWGLAPAWGVALGVALYLLRGPLHRVVKRHCLGRDLPAPAAPAQGGLARLAERERELGDAGAARGPGDGQG